MRSTRALFTGAAIAATLTLGAPAAAFAADVSDPGGHGGYSSSQESSEDGYGQGGSSWKDKDREEHGKEEQGKEEHGKEEQGKEEHGKEEPRKEEHESDWSGRGKDEDERDWSGHGKEEREHEWSGKKDDHEWSGGSWKDHEKGEKPRGGVHTGGGGMATTGSGMAAGSVLLLGGLGAGAYALRRRKPTGTAI
ncbi:hypothetical protein AB0B12_28585 [Streptomyces sp. NPDC044780]|uniref:hypothetical protein n=1 Tax=unclassified Streptomyces TaxID=2593676 RepID=UPI0033E19401